MIQLSESANQTADRGSRAGRPDARVLVHRRGLDRWLQPDRAVRRVRDEIRGRVQNLIDELLPT